MLNPALLWFLPLAAVPLILHLLERFRIREIELPTFRFLLDGYVQQRRRLRLLEWLLLALRTALVVLVVAALARPVIQRLAGLFGERGGREVVFVADVGLTTGLVSEGTSALHRIREAIRAAAARLGPGDFVTLVRAGVQPTVLHRAALGDGRRLGAALDTLAADPGPAALGAALVEGLSGPPRGARTAWIVTDGEARAWRRLGADGTARTLPPDARLVVLDVGHVGRVANAALLGDPPRAQRPVVGLPVEITARVAAAGTEPVEKTVSVLLDDELAAQDTVVVQPGTTVTRSLAVVPRRAGVIRGRLQIPADAFPEDDALVFALAVEPRVDVLVVAPADARGIDDPGLFVAAALEAPLETLAGDGPVTGPDGAGDGLNREIARSLDVTLVRGDKLDEARVNAADVIVLADVRLDGARSLWVRRQVQGGAGLVVAAGPRCDGRGDLPVLGDARGKNAAALTLEPAAGDPDDTDAGTTLGEVDTSHPVFGPFRAGRDGGAATGTVGLETLRVFRRVALAAAEGEGASSRPPVIVLARLADGTPVVAETRIGRGRVLVSGLAFTPDWSSLPVHPAFVPILLRAVQHVRRPAAAVVAESVRPGEPAPVRVDEAWRRATVEVTDPAGGRRAIELVAGDGHATGALTETLAVGHYDFTIEPPAGSRDEPLRLGMAVNRDVDGALLEHLGEAELSRILAPRAVTYLAGSGDDPVLAGTLGGRREIWRWLIGTALAVFAVEFVLSTLAPPVAGERAAGLRGWLGRLAGRLGQVVDGAEPGSV
ncbi:MAG: BatA domain-containing protein [Planctomycetes bacterium]|nr:BatA domain-containing protein [Planctomycetota bacterium]